MNVRKLFIWCSMLVCFLVVFNTGYCEEIPAFDETEALIFILKEKGVITNDEAARFLKIYNAGKSDKTKEVDERLKHFEDKLRAQEDKMRSQKNNVDLTLQELRSEILYNSVPDWVSKLKWKGDVRTRYQADLFDDANSEFLEADDFSKLANFKRDRHRVRLRARLDLLAEISNRVSAGIRLSTGSEGDPVSTNDTLGDYFNKDGLYIDRAYLKWTPVPVISFTGGRFENPFFSTDLVWDKDVNFEGLAISTDIPASESSGFFIKIGGFPLQEQDFYEDKWMMGYQVGTQFKPRADLKYRFGIAYYDFINVEGVPNKSDRPNEKDYTIPLYRQKGNFQIDIDPETDSIVPALASDYDEINATFRIDCAFYYPIDIILEFDFVTNVGFDKKRIEKILAVEAGTDENIDVPEETNGFMVALTVGHPKTRKLGEWKGYFAYKHLGADAVIDAFTDSDFHLGGTNAKGWVFSFQAGVAKNTWMTAKWISADEIKHDPLSVDIFQLDLNVSF